MSNVIRVLIVDDSAFVRKIVKEMLSRSPYLEVVGVARDGMEALEQVTDLQPDVVTCDLLMPRMDGIGFVREQMSRKPLPILILTATAEDGEKALQALDAGAVDIIQKPTALANEKILSIREELVEKIKAVAQAPVLALRPIVEPPKIIARVTRPVGKTKIVVIGISTGGPQALRFLLPQFPADFPAPIAIVLHMPVGYIQIYAEKLNELSRLEVCEVTEGDELEAGKVFFAQAGRHLALRRETETRVVATLPLSPVEALHRPSADVLFESAAECYGSGVLGVVMTGMGDDGKEGAARIKAKGGMVLTEAEESCVIYGMPRSVDEAGLSDGSALLGKMAETIMEKL